MGLNIKLCIHTLVYDLEDFDFLDSETIPTDEECFPVHARVVDVTLPKGSVTVGICVAITRNLNVIQVWTTIWALLEPRARDCGRGSARASGVATVEGG
jgi:hypothetical protein